MIARYSIFMYYHSLTTKVDAADLRIVNASASLWKTVYLAAPWLLSFSTSFNTLFSFLFSVNMSQVGLKTVFLLL